MIKASSGLGVKKLPILVLLLGLAGITPLFAIDIIFKPPVFTGNDDFGEYVVNQFNQRVDEVFTDLRKDIMDEIGGIDDNPQKLIGAFGTSSVFASSGATQRSYEGYDKFAVTLGSMIGFQLPSSPFSIANELRDFTTNLDEAGDMRLGVNPQALNAQIGINTSKFLLKNLYLGLKFGFMNLNFSGNSFGDVSFKTMSVGVMGNYQIFTHKSLGLGLLRWRGLSVGTGFIYQRTNLSYGFSLDPIEERISVPGYFSDDVKEALVLEDDDDIPGYVLTGFTVNVEATPRLSMDLSVNTYTIPLQAVTSVRLLSFLNLSFGLGADIGFGSAGLHATGNAEVDITGQPDSVSVDKPAEFSIVMGGDNSPAIFNPKIMAGIGFSLGPVIIDIPVTYYPMNEGYSVGITIGVAF